MKKIFQFSLFICLFLSLSAMTTSSDKVLGTWSYVAKDAPDGYDKGEIVISMEDDEYSASLVLGGFEIPGSSVKVDDDEVTFEIDLQQSTVAILMKVDGDSMSGSADSEMGLYSFKGEKKE